MHTLGQLEDPDRPGRQREPRHRMLLEMAEDPGHHAHPESQTQPAPDRHSGGGVAQPPGWPGPPLRWSRRAAKPGTGIRASPDRGTWSVAHPWGTLTIRGTRLCCPSGPQSYGPADVPSGVTSVRLAEGSAMGDGPSTGAAALAAVPTLLGAAERPSTGLSASTVIADALASGAHAVLRAGAGRRPAGAAGAADPEPKATAQLDQSSSRSVRGGCPPITWRTDTLGLTGQQEEVAAATSRSDPRLGLRAQHCAGPSDLARRAAAQDRRPDAAPRGHTHAAGLAARPP